MTQIIFFGILSILVVFPALLVVLTKNVFHSALWLVVSLAGVAGVYAMLAADFLFAVQLLVYIGGIMVLLLFVILLSGKPSDWAGRQVNDNALPAALFAAFFVTGIVSIIWNWAFPVIPSDPQLTTARLGQLLLGDMLIPFEVISLVLVLSLVGAIYFSQRKSS